MINTGVINLDGDSKVALVFGQMNEHPGARVRVALTSLTIAEYFRDEEGQRHASTTACADNNDAHALTDARRECLIVYSTNSLTNHF